MRHNYFITIRERDSVARARGATVGATLFGGHYVGHPAAARQAAIREFLTPLDIASLPESDRASGECLEALARVKRTMYLNGDCIVTCRKSKAKS